MPNRIIHEKALRSHTLANLSAEAERLFWRLTVIADDQGRFDAYPPTVKSDCFPTLVDKIPTKKIISWMEELTKECCRFYTVEGRTYGHFLKWAEYQRIYGNKPKFPTPPAECGEVPQNPALILIPTSTSTSTSTAVPEDDGTAVRFQEFWHAYPARSGKKLEKKETDARFHKLSTQDQALAVMAARHYAEALKHQGISSKDPKRFLLDGKGHEPWRDWIEPAQPGVQRPAPQCAYANSNEPCEASAVGGSKFCERHRDLYRTVRARKQEGVAYG